MSYEYQNKLIADTIASLRANHKPTVLAAAVSAGKTRMTMTIVEQLIQAGEVSSVLILAHGQTVIRSNMANEAIEGSKAGRISFTHVEIESRKDFDRWQASTNKEQVLIAIPQTLQKVTIPPTDMVIVDEAHQFFFESMVKTIIKSASPKYVLCLTGTPAKFIREDFPVIAISIFELRGYKAISNPTITQGLSAYDFTLDDINDEGNLRDKVSLTEEQTNATMDDLLQAIHQKKLFGEEIPVGVGETYKALGKTMIACPSQPMAVQVEAYFQRNGVPVLLSTSKYGEDAKAIEGFGKDPDKSVLIVVNRGVLGYSCKELINLVDMTCSLNMDRMMQLYGRILRIDEENRDAAKFYLRLVPKKLADYSYHMLNLMMSLCDRKNYLAFDGNLRKMPFRAKKFDSELIESEGSASAEEPGIPSQGNGGSKPRTRRVPVWELDTLDYMSRVYSDPDGVYSDMATTTMAEVEARLTGRVFHKTVEEHIQEAQMLVSEYGWIPVQSWLISNGRNDLVRCIQGHPEAFAVFPQQPSLLKSLEDHIKTAEMLVKEHGFIPGSKWRQKNGYYGLDKCMLKTPEAFAVFPQQPSRVKSLEDHIKTAEMLVAEHGWIPGPWWLIKNGRSDLDQCIRKYPEAFSEFPRQPKGKRGYKPKPEPRLEAYLAAD